MALHEATKRLKQLATTDPVTGLPNRMLLLDRLGQALALARRERRHVALLVLDIDGFRGINESFGHTAGDEALAEMARRVQRRLRSSDTAGRASGGELAAVLTTVASPEDAELVARDMLEQVARPFELHGREIFVTASIGIATSPRDATDAALLLQHAEVAMHAAKGRGGNAYQVFSPSMAVEAHERMSLSSSLRRALERHELVLHYQPQVDARTGRVVAVEALVRWNHPELGLLGPPSFLPLAEESGLIVDIDRWVVGTACGQAAAWAADGVDIGRVAVNASTRTLEEPDFVETVAEALTRWELQPSMLEIEITETALMHAGGEATQTLMDLRSMGVGIAIDDFGAGYSSLRYLKQLPVDTLKIDQAFVMDIGSHVPGNHADIAILKSIIALGQGLGLRLVAEGVETEGQRDMLRFLHCDVMQGLLVRHPVPPADLADLLGGMSRRRLRRRVHAGDALA